MFFQILKRIISYILLLLGGFPILIGQQNISLKQLSIDQGLPGVTIQCAFQDSKGIMWFGVESVGLCRFDGHDFVVYENNPEDPYSISNNFAEEIIEGDSGSLWIGTLNGFNEFDRKTGKFNKYFHNPDDKYSLTNNSIFSLIKDRYGNIWLGTRHGLSKFNPRKNEFVNVLNQYKYSILSLTVFEIFEDSKGDIWIGTRESGIFKIDAETNFQHTQEWESKSASELQTKLKISAHLCIENSESKGLNTNYISDIISAGKEKMWIGTYSGLLLYDKKNDSFEKFSFDKPGTEAIQNADYANLLIDQKGRLWAGTMSNGLVVIDTATGKYSYYHEDQIKPKGLKSNSIRSIIKDRSGLVWILTKFEGAHIYDKRQELFSIIGEKSDLSEGLSNKYILSIIEDASHDIWIGTKYGGLNKIDSKTGKISSYINGTEPRMNRVEAMIEYNNNYLLLGLQGGMSQFNKRTGEFKNLESHDVKSLVRDKNGHIWVGSYYSGLFIYDWKNNTLKPYQKTKFKKLFRSLTISGVYVDRINNLWILTWEGGLYRYSIQRDEITHYLSDAHDTTTISGNMIRAFYEDDNGLIYIGNKSDGFNILDQNTGVFKRISKKDGFQSNTVYSIEKDLEGDFWLGTHDGLVKYNPAEETFIHFNELYGLQGKVYEMNAHFIAHDSTMYFGGSNGLNYFNPTETTKSSYFSPIVISSLKVFNSKIDVDITENRSYNLKYSDKYITIDFALLDYSDPKTNMYTYKLEHFDQNWIECGNRHFATYTNLSPGNYTFTVKAASVDEIWNNEGLSIDLAIKAPVYRRGWFIILVILFLASIILLTYYLRVQAIRKNEKLLISIVDQKTIDLSNAYEKLEKQKLKIEQHNEELLDKQEKISFQNLELEGHRENLEKIVQERTSDLELAKQKAIESDLLKSAFLANMSHEIRTPLNAIVGFSKILVSKEYDEEDLDQINSVISNSSASLLQLVNDIIDISKIESNQIEILIRPFNLKDFLENIHMLFLSQVLQNEDKNHLDFSLKIPTKLKDVKINSDASRLEQVFLNLLNNALKFTVDGYIEMGCMVQESHKIRFYVKDTGIGISKENIEVIFDRFRKVEDDRSQLFRGTGLGLAISSNLIKLLGGDVWVESEMNKGTVFYFEIPLVEGTGEDKVLSKSKKNNLVHPDWSKKNILIVEDEESNFQVLHSILKRTKINIKHVVDGLEAVKLFEIGKETKFDLILMDIKLPVLNGVEATEKIKTYNKTIPIIAQTAYAMNNEKVEIMQAGFNEYVTKPIVPNDLIDKMSRFI